jgi:hypothetical protein
MFLTASSHLLSSATVQSSGSKNASVEFAVKLQLKQSCELYILPVGSCNFVFSAGKISPPHMLHAAAAVMIPAKPERPNLVRNDPPFGRLGCHSHQERDSNIY